MANLDMGNGGTNLLRWDMNIALPILEEIERSRGKRKNTPPKKATPSLFVKLRSRPKGGILRATQEASLALASLAKDKVDDNLDQDIEAHKVMEEMLDLELQTLDPSLINGVEVLFLDDDISHILEMH